ncbi:MAG: DUF5716 family protein [Lachnospiraceae bacterium]|nr:DUF5716 family protein [Lachnospiraceae bacterium]
MILKDKIPETFYKLFRTKNMDAYMSCLVAIYEENNRMLYSFGMTEDEVRAVIDETLANLHILWQMDEEEDRERLEEKHWQDAEMPDMLISSATILHRLVRWGWLNSSYDEKMNENMIAFPEYSQLYVELFERLGQENSYQERQSILSIYSELFTYVHSPEKEKNTHILEHALIASRGLSQMLSNMQDGMRGYFEELAGQTDFLGIQEVLVREISNQDSKKYAILTTKDSFYRYKESVKELISEILAEQCERSDQLAYRIEREFDAIEKKYNNLIRQKTVFAKRALARLKYMMQEGAGQKDSISHFVQRLGSGTEEEQQQLLAQYREVLQLSVPMKLFSADSLYRPRQEHSAVYVPVEPRQETEQTGAMEDFVPKPLYTKKELQDFRGRHMQNGVFRVTQDSIQGTEDLEKLLLLWQEATDDRLGEDTITLGEEMTNEQGLSFTGLTIR